MKWVLFGALSLLAFSPALAQERSTLNVNLPGSYPTSSPVGILGNFFEFALMIGGLLAFGAIVWGGVRYAVAAGNPGAQTDARDQITQALLGLLLLVGATLILQTINPSLASPALPELPDIFVPETRRPMPTPVPSNNCISGPCQSLQAAGFTCKSSLPACNADEDMIAALRCMERQVGTLEFVITEAMPPTVPHRDRRHYTGCAVDMVVKNFRNCSQVEALVDAAYRCGGSALNEYAQACGGARTGGATGDHVHVNGCE